MTNCVTAYSALVLAVIFCVARPAHAQTAPAGPVSTWTTAGRSPVTPGDAAWTLKAASGWIHTNRWYLDFELELEFRCLERGSNGGVLVRARGGRDYRAGYRINLSDRFEGSNALGRIVSRQVHGPRLELKERQFDQQVLSSAAKPGSEWQTLRIVTEVREIRVTLNDALIAVVDSVPQAGHIGFEGDGGSIEIRQVRITRREPYLQALPPSGASLVYADKSEYKTNGVILPKVLNAEKTNYSPDAMQRAVVGTVLLEFIVLADGTVGPIHIIKPLDSELDQEAVGTVRQWLFRPGQKDGQSMAFRLEAEMSFSLR